ncbi:uncharacterized protein LOC144552946 [Carex rostrata]
MPRLLGPAPTPSGTDLARSQKDPLKIAPHHLLFSRVVLGLPQKIKRKKKNLRREIDACLRSSPLLRSTTAPLLLSDRPPTTDHLLFSARPPIISAILLSVRPLTISSPFDYRPPYHSRSPPLHRPPTTDHRPPALIPFPKAGTKLNGQLKGSS